MGVGNSRTGDFIFLHPGSGPVQDNAISYKMQYDSILIVSKVQSKDSTVTILYNSNKKDSVYNYLISYNLTRQSELLFT